MAISTLGKRTRSSKQEGECSSYNITAKETAVDSRSAEPTLSLDFSAKRPRRTPKKTSEKEHISIHDKENQENEQPESDSQGEPEPTPTKCQSRRTSIASTVRSCR
jgi:cell division control protein 6